MRLKSEYPLRSWLKNNHIKGVLFDFDDTLIQTTEIFQEAVKKVVTLYLQALPSLNFDNAHNIFSRINIENHSKYAVNPKRWTPIITQFEQELQLQTSISKQTLQILSDIYTIVPKFEPGAEIVLDLLRNWNLEIGLVTHANIDWTMFKLAYIDLGYFFDDVYIVDENKPHKDKEDWNKAAQQIQIPTQKLLAVGDNIKGDIQAANKAGFRVVWVNKKNGFSLYRQGDLPYGTITINNVGELLTIGK